MFSYFCLLKLLFLFHNTNEVKNVNVDYKLIGNRIKTKRKQQNKTQEQLAEELSVTVGYISQLERGITKPNLEFLAKLSCSLNCDIAFFISDTVVSKYGYLKEEFTQNFSELKDNEKQLVLDLIQSIIKNRK